MHKTNYLLLFILCFGSAFAKKKEMTNPRIDNKVTIYPEQYKQTILGLGVEIQSDAIGSGNTGMPNSEQSVPHDLTLAERERFAKEMMQGFRYCRLAGGLYWRGLDKEERYLQPRWPEQLEELKILFDQSGIEGVSLEYWSVAPYWKANRRYVGEPGKKHLNTLRCFAEGFEKDADYNGDTIQFLKDFGIAMAKDLQTLKEAGIKTNFWSVSNEPWTNNTQYSSCYYKTAEDYIKAYVAGAKAVRELDPSIVLISDTEHGYPRKIAKGMHRKEVADLVDMYAVHTIGWDSERVLPLHKKITKELPERLWFQNEYEYLTGGATPKRCLNTVQHIMTSFQEGENPTWFWLHALKPFKNSEASGYSLGFWKSLDDTTTRVVTEYQRWVGGPEITEMPEQFKAMDFVNAQRKNKKKPGVLFSYILHQPATVYLAVEQTGTPEIPKGFEKSDLIIEWEGGTDVLYVKECKAGKVAIGTHKGKVGEEYGAPHACFIDFHDVDAEQLISVGINSPIKIRSEALKLEKAALDLKPGHWFYNDYNWNAVGSFSKQIPWNSRVLKIQESARDKDARILVFEAPNGKRTIVVANRGDKAYTFSLATQINKAKWKGVRYSPHYRGKNSMGVPVGTKKGSTIEVTLAPMTWEFWSEL